MEDGRMGKTFYYTLTPSAEERHFSYNASVAERSIAIDCKSIALWATQVQILPDAPSENSIFFVYRIFALVLRRERVNCFTRVRLDCEYME